MEIKCNNGIIIVWILPRYDSINLYNSENKCSNEKPFVKQTLLHLDKCVDVLYAIITLYYWMENSGSSD